MPPAAKKDASVILFDLGTEPAAKQTLIKICCNTYLYKLKDLTKLVLFNSEVTQNRLNAHYGGYNQIHEVAPELTVYSPRGLVGMIDESNSAEGGNWLEALLVALKNLEEEFQFIGGIFTHQVLFLTDLKSPLGDYDDKLVDKVIRSIKKIGAFVYIVGPQVEPPFTINNQGDVRRWMKDFYPEDDNLCILKKIIMETENTLVCDYKMGVHLFFAVRNSHGTQPWQVPLDIGSKIKIPAKTMKGLNTEPKCKLKKQRGTFRPMIWVDAEDETIEVDRTDVISGIMRHGKFVQMPDNKMFQVENPRSFSVLCFTESVNVPEYLMLGAGNYHVAPNAASGKRAAFNILVDTLAKQKKYVIARRIYNKNFNPKIVVLVPKPDHNPKCFLLASLPYNDNIRVNYKEIKLEAVPKTEPSDEVYAFLDSMNVENEKGGLKMSLGVNMLRNVNNQRIINKTADKIFDKHMGLQDLDVDVLKAPQGADFEKLRDLWEQRELKERKPKEEAGDDGSDEDFEW